MTDELQPSHQDAPVDGASVWLRALQAALVGLVAGLALQAILSIAVLEGRDAEPAHAGSAECRKAAPARDAVPPALDGPAMSGLWWMVEAPDGNEAVSGLFRPSS